MGLCFLMPVIRHDLDLKHSYDLGPTVTRLFHKPQLPQYIMPLASSY